MSTREKSKRKKKTICYATGFPVVVGNDDTDEKDGACSIKKKKEEEKENDMKEIALSIKNIDRDNKKTMKKKNAKQQHDHKKGTENNVVDDNDNETKNSYATTTKERKKNSSGRKKDSSSSAMYKSSKSSPSFSQSSSSSSSPLSSSSSVSLCKVSKKSKKESKEHNNTTTTTTTQPKITTKSSTTETNTNSMKHYYKKKKYSNQKNQQRKTTSSTKPQKNLFHNHDHLEPPYSFYNKHKHNNHPSPPLPQQQQYTYYREGIQSIANLLQHKKNILVLAGAGISVSCGIPDFRSKNTGLYSTLDSQGLGLNCAEDLFDLEFFTDNPKPFYKFARNLYPGYVTPSASHKFLALLEERKMLLRVYTQNIDGLEEVAGVSPKKIVYAHGSLTWAQCMKCRRKFDAKDISKDVMAGIVPRCKRPVSNLGSVRLLKRKESSESIMSGISMTSSVSSSSFSTNKRSRRRIASRKCSYNENDACDDMMMNDDNNACVAIDDNNEQENRASLSSSGGLSGEEENRDCQYSMPSSLTSPSLCNGVIKPGVTFFGEKLDDKVARCLKSDHAKADALIVMGTSLSVAPMSKVIQYLPPSIPRILINRNVVKAPKHSPSYGESDQSDDDFRDGYVFDACLLGFCDDVTRYLVKEMRLDDGRTSALDDSTSPIFTEDEGKVLSSADGNGDNVVLNRGIHNHPPERIFLFPGAVIDRDDSDSDVTYKEVAHCDGCQEQICGKIMKCTECFDYDLCMKCYPELKKSHSGGNHTFVAE